MYINNNFIRYKTTLHTNRQKTRLKTYKKIHAKLKILQIIQWFNSQYENLDYTNTNSSIGKLINQIISNINTILEGKLTIIEPENTCEDIIKVLKTPEYLIDRYKKIKQLLSDTMHAAKNDNMEVEEAESARTWPSFDPLQKQCVMWHNGDKVNKKNACSIQEDRIREHKQASTTNPTHQINKPYLNVLSINIPHYNVKNQSYNVLRELVDRYEEIDIFMMSELYWQENHMHVVEPPGYIIIWNKKGEIKTSAIMYKTLIEDNVVDVSTDMLAGVEVRWNKTSTEKLFAVYHTQSRIYDKLFQQYGFTGITAADQYSRSILYEILDKSHLENVIIAGDVNWNINETGRTKTRPYEKIAMHAINKSPLYNEWGDKPSFKTKTGYSTLDVCLVGQKSSIRNFDTQMSDLSMISDHYAGTFEIPFHLEIRRKSYITFREKTYKYNLNSKYGIFNPMHDYRHNSTNDELTQKYIQLQHKATNVYNETLLHLESKDVLEPEDITTIYNSITNISDITNPIKTIMLKGRKIQKLRTPEYIDLRRKANNRHKDLIAYGGDPKEDRTLIGYNKELKRMNQNMTRHAWKRKISERIQIKKLSWSFVEEFQNQDRSIPGVLVEDDFALHFLKLMYDYTPLTQLPDKVQMTVADDNKYSIKLPIVPQSLDPNVSLKKHIFGIKSSEHSAGPDGITLAFLRLLPEKYYGAIAKYVTSLLMHGVYQEEFRKAKCSAIYKRADRKLAKNYRPIQIVTTMCNLVERIFAFQSTNAGIQNGHLSENSYGFQAGKSTGMLISQMGKFYYSKRNNKNTMHVILVTDLSNAFGSPDDLAIMNEFTRYYNEDALRMLRSFLIQPTCMVELQGKKSCDYDASRRGFSQGSTKSPYAYVQLFARCHNIFDDATQMLSFADDATILISDDNFENIMQKTQTAMEKFNKYCTDFNIKVNSTKTFVKIFGRKLSMHEKEQFKVKLEDTTLEIKEEVNILGIHFNKDLRRQVHVNKMTSKFKSYNALIGQFGRYTDTKMVRTMIQSYHYGKFNYGSAYMGNFNLEQNHQLQVVINNLLRRNFVKMSDLRLPIEERPKISQYELLNRAKLLSIPNVHRKNQMMGLGKLVESCFPVREFEEFVKCLTFKMNRRQKSKRFLPLFGPCMDKNITNKIRQLEFAPYCWSEEYERLPEPIRSNLGTKLFRPAIKKYYAERCQHDEKIQRQCLACMENTRIYSDPVLVNLVRQQWYRKNEPEIVDNLINEFDTWANIINQLEEHDFYKYFQLTQDDFDLISWEESDFLKRLYAKGWFSEAGQIPNPTHACMNNSASNKNIGKRFKLFNRKRMTFNMPM